MHSSTRNLVRPTAPAAGHLPAVPSFAFVAFECKRQRKPQKASIASERCVSLAKGVLHRRKCQNPKLKMVQKR